MPRRPRTAPPDQYPSLGRVRPRTTRRTRAPRWPLSSTRSTHRPARKSARRKRRHSSRRRKTSRPRSAANPDGPHGDPIAHDRLDAEGGALWQSESGFGAGSVARMARFGVRSGSVAFARLHGTRANGSEHRARLPCRRSWVRVPSSAPQNPLETAGFSLPDRHRAERNTALGKRFGKSGPRQTRRQGSSRSRTALRAVRFDSTATASSPADAD